MNVNNSSQMWVNNASFTGNGNVNINNNGQLFVVNNGSFTGAGNVNINGGALMLNSGSFSNASGNVYINNGATLGGIGTIAGLTTVTNGSLAPGFGSTYGSLDFTNANGLNINGNSVLDLGINGANVDGLTVSGLLNITAGTPVIDFVSLTNLSQPSYILASYSGNAALSNASFTITGAAIPSGYELFVYSGDIVLANTAPNSSLIALPGGTVSLNMHLNDTVSSPTSGSTYVMELSSASLAGYTASGAPGVPLPSG